MVRYILEQVVVEESWQWQMNGDLNNKSMAT